MQLLKTDRKVPESVILRQHNRMADFRLDLPGNPVAVRQALDSVREWLHPLGPSDGVCGVVELVLAEVMNNVVEHAFADTLDGVIGLHISAIENGLNCEVWDNGRPMPTGHLPQGHKPNLNCGADDLPEGGFGWFLIRDLTRDIEYCREAGKNRLRFCIPLEFTQKLTN